MNVFLKKKKTIGDYKQWKKINKTKQNNKKRREWCTFCLIEDLRVKKKVKPFIPFPQKGFKLLILYHVIYIKNEK